MSVQGEPITFHSHTFSLRVLYTFLATQEWHSGLDGALNPFSFYGIPFVHQPIFVICWTIAVNEGPCHRHNSTCIVWWALTHATMASRSM